MAFRPSSALSLRAAVPLLAVAGLPALLPEGQAATLEFARGEIMHGQVWRLWTAHLVYFSAGHALLDLAALVALAGVALAALGPRVVWLGLLVGAPLVSLGLFWLVSDMTTYRGSSALAYLLGTAAGIALWQTRREWRTALALLAILAVAKALFDAIGAGASLSSLPSGVRVAWQAHLLGALAAVTAATCRRWLRPCPPPSGSPCTPH